MRWDGSSSFLKNAREALRDHWVLANLVLRLILLVFVLRAPGFMQSDSQYYLENADRICHGLWGGDGNRTPMYSWILCGFSIWGSAQIALTLVFQTLVIWLGGLALYRRKFKLVSLLWLFDPVLLAYSNIVMTDGLFAVSILGLALSMQSFLRPDASIRKGLAVGLWAAVSILLRPIGIPVVAITWLGLAAVTMIRKLPLKSWLAATALLIALLSPILLWNHSRDHRWYIASQGSGWIEAVAGVVEYRGSGLNFLDAELRWHHEHPGAGSREAYQTIAHHLPSWAWLSTKGMLRVLVGNVNSEYAAIFTGHVPLGPGWFKEGDQDAPQRVHGIGLVLWVAGLLLVAGYCVCLYTFILCQLYRAREMLRTHDHLWLLWAATTAALLIAVPQVYGDARFRAPVISILLPAIFLTRTSGSGSETRSAL